MASFFGNRPSYVTASWQQNRIYPRQEPTFEQSSPTPPTNLRRSSTRNSPFDPLIRTNSGTVPSTTTTTATTTPNGEEPTRERPPPLYFPGVNRPSQPSNLNNNDLNDADSTLPNHIPSINVATTKLIVVEWLYHPIPLRSTLKRRGDKWKKWLRFPEIWSSLRQDREVLWDGWPVEFGGTEEMPMLKGRPRGGDGIYVDEETGTTRRSSLSRSISKRSTSTSTTTTMTNGQQQPTSIELSTTRSSRTTPQVHPLEPLYHRRISELNELIAESLMLTRGWMSLVELMWIVWVVALIVALGTGKGGQSGFLKGVEIGLVVVIILSALAINGVRMRRWALAEQLRKRTRDWSPLPITSSTNSQLMRNYLDGEADERTGNEENPMVGRNGIVGGGGGGGTTGGGASGWGTRRDSPVLRWRLRETEGGFWLSYRPIVRCELITPATFKNPFSPPSILDELSSSSAPPPPATGATLPPSVSVQNNVVGGEEPPRGGRDALRESVERAATVGGGDLPPGYDERM